MEVGLIQGGGMAELAALTAESERYESQVQQSDFYKAVQAGYGTDHATLVGGAALRRESLEASLITTVQQNKHFVFWNRVPKGKATATVDEFSRHTDIGGVQGSSANGELDEIPENTGVYDRQTALVKFLMDRRRVSVVAEVQSRNGLASAIARETNNGTKKLLTDANWLSYYGNSACVAAEFDGLVKIMEGVGGDHVYDMAGSSITANAKEFIDSAQLIWGQGNWGRATDYFCSPAIQTDLDQKLDPAHRVVLDNRAQDIRLGAPVRGIHTNFGDITTNIDPFVQEGQKPYVVRGTVYAALVGTAVAPASVAGVAAPTAGSKFQTAHAGGYYYAAEGRKQGGGCSALVVSGQVAVAKGDGVTVTITHGAANDATAFQLYRNNTDGGNTNSDFREMVRLAAANAATTIYVDLNQNIPGTSIIMVMTMVDDAVTMQRLMDMTRFPLYPTTRAEHLWAQLLFCYLRVAKPNQHRLLKNALPSSASWRPFNV